MVKIELYTKDATYETEGMFTDEEIENFLKIMNLLIPKENPNAPQVVIWK